MTSKLTINFFLSSLNKGVIPYQVTVEGNIGSGKTSFLKLLSYQFMSVQLETVDEWVDYHGVNLLKQMYERPYRTTFLFQMKVLFNKFNRQMQDHNSNIIIHERSLWSAWNIFVASSVKHGFLSRAEFAVLWEWHKYCEKQLQNKSTHSLIIYLRAKPATSYSRIQHRGRKGEESLSKERLEELHKRHDYFLKNRKQCKRRPFTKVITIDVERNADQLSSPFASVVQTIYSLAAEPYLA